MADLEAPEQFAERLFGLVASDAAAAIRARDRQVREAALRETADWLAAKVQEVREVTRDCRRARGVAASATPRSISAPSPPEPPMAGDLPTVSAADVIARYPCGNWPARIPALCARYRRERWSALEILSVDDVSAEDRLWVCLHPSLVPVPVLTRFVCEVAAEALRVVGVTDERSWAALDVRMRHARGEATDAELGAAWDAARAAARAAASAAAWNAAWDAASADASAAVRAAVRAAARAAAWNVAWDAASAAAWAAQVVTLRTLLLLHADGYDVTRGELGKLITERRAA